MDPYPLYRTLTSLSGPLLRMLLQHRLRKGKEDRSRLGERMGIASQNRPDKPLIWCHGASVGESLALLPLIDQLRAERPNLAILMTTGTVTSATLMAQRLPKSVLHSYVPVDHPAWVARFLDHWRPDGAIFAESDLWPNLVEDAARRNIPLALVNGRLSERSWVRWLRYPGLMRRLAGHFSLALVQTKRDRDRFSALAFDPVEVTGNIKFAVPAPIADPERVSTAQSAVAGRPVWLAASTHEGEEVMAAEVHRQLKDRIPNLLTIIVPRHPQRCDQIHTSLSAEFGLQVKRRSETLSPGSQTEVFLGDSMGEMGLYCRMAPVVVMGKSFAKGGGQNPIEPARLGCAVLWGPSMSNFEDIATRMEQAGAAETVADTRALTSRVGHLLADPAAARAMGQAGLAFAAGEARVLEEVFTALNPWLDQAIGAEHHAGP